MALLDEIRQKNPSLSNRSDEELKAVIRQSPEFKYFNDDEFDAFVTGRDAQASQQEGGPGFMAGVSAGIDQLQAMGGGLVMAAGEALESPGMLEAGRDIYSRNMEQAAENDLGYGFTDIRSVGDAWNWARYTAGNQLPMLAASIAGGGVGGVTAGLTARTLAGATAKEGAKRAGQALGAIGASTGMETGALMGETEDLDVSLAHGVLAGSLDAVTPLRLLRAAGKSDIADQAASEISDRVLADLQREAARTTRSAAGRGSLTNVMAEASTEGLQGLINQHANYWVENNGETLLANLGDVDLKALVDEAAAGGLMGGVVGAPAGVLERNQARTQVDRVTQAREQTAAQGGDALDQATAGLGAEQQAQGEQQAAEQAPEAQAQRQQQASEVGLRIQRGLQDADDLQALARGASFEGSTRLRNMDSIIKRAEAALEAGEIERAGRIMERAENIANDLRSALRTAGTRERPMEGELADPEQPQPIAGLLRGRQGQLPPGTGDSIRGESPQQFEARQRTQQEQSDTLNRRSLGRDDVIYGEGPTRDVEAEEQARRAAFERQYGTAQNTGLDGEYLGPDALPGRPNRQGDTYDGETYRRPEQLRQDTAPRIPQSGTIYGEGPIAGNANTGMDQPFGRAQFTDTGARESVEGRRPQQQESAERVAQLARTRGRGQTTYLPDNTPIRTRFRVVEASELTASNSPDGRVNQRYPQELQPRDRTNANSQVQVRNIAARLNPERLGSSNDAGTGAPIIGSDGVVESGNGRTMAITTAYSQNSPQAQRYREFVRAEAERQGIDPSAVDEMQQPVLVRERVTNVDRADFARRANESQVAGMTAYEQAQADADSLTAADLQAWAPDESGDPLAASNRSFQRGFVQRLGNNEASRYTTRDGQATPELGQRMQRAVFAAAYQDPDMVEMVTEQAENMRNLAAGLQAAAADLAVARETGSRDALDAIGTINDAVRLVRRSRQDGISVRELTRQADAFTDAVPETTALLAIAINNSMRSRQAMTTAFGYIGRAVRSRAEGEANGVLFADDTTNGDIFDAGFQGQNQNQRTQQRPPEGNVQPGAQRSEQGSEGQGQAEPTQRPQAEQPAQEVDNEPLLSTYTEQELAEREQAQQQSEEAEASQQREEAQRAQADAEADDFTLSGSSRTADTAASRNQDALFSLRSQREQTMDSDFDNWFSDSQVTDDGEPRVVYHATFDEFDTFDFEKLGSFTAENVVDDALVETAKMGAWFSERSVAKDMAAPISYEAYLSIDAPADFMGLDHLLGAIEDAGDAEALREQLKEEGYDGIRMQDDEFNTVSWVAFDASQIRRATPTPAENADAQMQNAESEANEAPKPKRRNKPLEYTGYSGEERSVRSYQEVGNFRIAKVNDSLYEVINPDGQAISQRAGPNGAAEEAARLNDLPADDQRYAIGQSDARPVSRDAIKEALASSPELSDVTVIQSATELPPQSILMMALQGVNPRDVRGLFVGDQLYVIADNVDDVQEGVRTAVHEAVGHKGMRAVLGDDLDRVMLNLYRNLPNSKEGRDALREVRRDYPFLDPESRKDRITIAEEMVAHLLEKGHRPNAWQRAVAKIRELLRQLFPSVAWTYTDALALGEQSREYLRKQKAEAQPAEPRFAMAGDTASRNFKRWFGDSKAVEPDGSPTVVYHGTRGDFSAFSSDLFGSGVGGEARNGFFFTSDPSEASEYAAGSSPGGNVIAAHLSLQKPLEVSYAQHGISDIIDSDADVASYLRSAQGLAARLRGRDGLILRGIGGVRGRDLYVAFRPEQVKSVFNQGAYDPANPDIRYALRAKQRTNFEDSFSDFTDADRAAAAKIGSRTPPQRAVAWFKEKADRAGLKIRQGMVDRYAALKEMDERLYGESALGENIQRSSWVLARMSNAANGALHAMLHNGRIKLNQQERIIEMQDGDAKGLGEVLGRLGSAAEIERFMGWIAGNRAARLAQDGRENLFDVGDINAMQNWNRGQTEDGRSRQQLYKEVFDEFQQYRDDVLAVAEQSGIITSEQREMWGEEFYVPFYRLAEDDQQVSGMMATSGLSRQQAYKRLKGGSQNLNDLLQNTMMNFHHLLDASLKNQAATQAIENAKKLGMAERVPESNRDTKRSTFVMENGKKAYYEIDDPLVFTALTALAHPGMNSMAMKVMRGFKRVFTNLTTTTPQFMVANLIRDSLQASATSDVSKNAFKNVIEGGRSYKDERIRAQMLASGASFNFGHLYGNNPDELRAQLTRNMRNAKLVNGPSMAPNVLRAGWTWWNDVNNATENLNRAAIYSQNRDKGALRAAFESRDLIDFSAHGAWPAVRILIDIVPFLNARIQGLDKIYRSGMKPGVSVLAEAFGKGKAGVTEKQAAARFWTVTGAVTLATIALYLHNQDDEEYQKLEEWQKDTYWFFRAGNQAFFIPKPFEVGAIATLAERMTEQFVDDKATGKLFAQRLGHMMTDTFSFSPVPQMMQPALDIYANYDAFTGRPIESMGMERLSPELRRRANTSKAAEWISGALNSTVGAIGDPDKNPLALSPVQVDHLIGGYFGQVGTWVASSADVAWRAATGVENPAQRWYEYQPVRRFYRNLGDEDRYTKYGTIFYEGLREANRAYSDAKELREMGRLADAAEVATNKRDMLALRLPLNRAQRRLNTINQQVDIIRRSNLDGEVKRQRIDRLNAVKNQIQRALGEQVQEARAR